eukprot:TRINITY_DN849_c0_g1_i1.p1 TRINITY_DN849_c0_g1~~TRINITY_DN849_c0_g1_i1.p1  ORF type:complete len:644 (-),score=101.46 TRINITY_DN849_c0_g1_i1:859-2790(-)
MSIGSHGLLIVTVVVAALQGVLGVNPTILACLNSLEGGQYIENGHHGFGMGDDCTLRLYSKLLNESQVLWQAEADEGGTGCTARLEGSGDLIIIDSNKDTEWRSNSTQVNRNYLILDKSGIVSIKVLITGQVLWSTNRPQLSASDLPTIPTALLAASPQVWEAQSGVLYMVAGYYLPVGTPLQNGPYSLRLNQTCYLELRSSDRLLWGSDSGGPPGDSCKLALQYNGTLQILNENGNVAWASNYSGPPSYDSYILFLGDNGDVSIFDSLQLKTPVWTGFPAEKGASNVWKTALGIAIGVVVFLIVALAVIFWVSAVYLGYGLGFFDPAAKSLAKRMQGNGGSCKPLSLSKIRQATNGFEKKLGEGGFGTVYFGTLSDGQDVAIKVLSATSRQGMPEFFNEIELLSVVHHKYLVSLVGYCLAWKKQILVYEYVSGGDLQERLHGDSSLDKPLAWKERTSIILQVAEGIEYLHHGCPRAIIHRDLKCSNILLTDKGTVKVADFGLSKLIGDEFDATHITTVVKGTFGYLDPEYSITGNLTEKSDVYAFGVILMEIVTGQPLTNDEKIFIGNRVRQALKSGHVESLADPTMGASYSIEEFRQLINLSQWCVKKNGYDRPSMTKVVQELRDIGLVQLGPLKSAKAGY